MKTQSLFPQLKFKGDYILSKLNLLMVELYVTQNNQLYSNVFILVISLILAVTEGTIVKTLQ